jgi:hypothetical protein
VSNVFRALTRSIKLINLATVFAFAPAPMTNYRFIIPRSHTCTQSGFVTGDKCIARYQLCTATPI